MKRGSKSGKKEDRIRRAAYVIQIDVEAASDGVSRERETAEEESIVKGEGLFQVHRRVSRRAATAMASHRAFIAHEHDVRRPRGEWEGGRVSVSN